MTIQSPTARASFVCNSVSTVFPVNIQAYLATDFLVLLTNAAGSTTLTLNSDYTLVASGSLSPTFWTLTTQTGQFVSPYVTGNTLQVILNPSETQLSQYTQGQAFPSLAVQTNLDRLTQMDIRLSDQIGRTIRQPDGDVTAWNALVSAVARANSTLIFDALGNPATGVLSSNITTKANVIGLLTDSGFRYIIHPIETAVGLISANLTFGFDPGDVRRYGLKDDNGTDNGPKMATIVLLAQAGLKIYWSFQSTGKYLTSVALLFTVPVFMFGDPGARIKLTATSPYVIKWDCSGGGGSFSHGGQLADLILDGGGFAADGLYLRNVVSANFYRIRSTNLSGWGIHLAWAQLCYFDTPTCSNNIEAFGVVPAGGCLIDNANGGGSSSANIFMNPCWEQMQTSAGAGIGCKAQWAINSVFLNGTSEGNKIGMIIGDLTTGTGIGNSLVGMDMESNVTADLQILGAVGIGYNNDVIGGKCTSTNSIFVTGGASNHFSGGFNGGVTFDSVSNHNTLRDVGLFGAAATITDAGVANSWGGIYNISTAAVIAEMPVRRRANFVLAATGSVTIDCSVTALATVTYSGAGAGTITFNAPTNPRDSYDLDICLHAAGAGAITLAWAGAVGGFKQAGIVIPANGFNRTYRFRYDPNNGFWYLAAISPADIPN